MPARKFVSGIDCRELIDEAIERHLPITLTNRQGDNWQVYKSHFVRRQSGTLMISLPTPDTADHHMEPAAGQEVAITFKKGYNKCLFISRIVRQETLQLEPGISMPVIDLIMPEQIEKIQRRAFDRARVPEQMDVPVTLKAQEPGFSPPIITGRLHDLSAGGAGVIFTAEVAGLLRANLPFLMTFTPLPGQETIQIAVRVRHTIAEEKTGAFLTGLQLMGLELSEEGRAYLRQLGRIVGVYERYNQFSEVL